LLAVGGRLVSVILIPGKKSSFTQRACYLSMMTGRHGIENYRSFAQLKPFGTFPKIRSQLSPLIEGAVFQKLRMLTHAQKAEPGAFLSQRNIGSPARLRPVIQTLNVCPDGAVILPIEQLQQFGRFRAKATKTRCFYLLLVGLCCHYRDDQKIKGQGGNFAFFGLNFHRFVRYLRVCSLSFGG